jgi:ADP-ribosylation factor-like protein 2
MFSGYTLNLWDVGGQKSLRSYWRNYFESTDGLVWVVDSADRMRLDACREELNILLLEERLAGATLLVLANKQDLPGALSAQEIKDVRLSDLINYSMFSNNFNFSNRFSNLKRSQHIIGRSWA